MVSRCETLPFIPPGLVDFFPMGLPLLQTVVNVS